MLLFQTDGKPINVTSQISCNSASISLCSPGSQAIAKDGNCLVGVAKCIFHQPHLQPFATKIFSQCFFIIHKISQVLASLIMVQTGTFTKTSGAFSPYC
jgi:hypothetical protein